MTKLTKDDFTASKGAKGGEFWDGPNGSWLSVRASGGTFAVWANSLDWFDEEGGTTVDVRDGFVTLDEALAWGAETIGDVPARLACKALETAFEAMAEWLPLVLPALATARAEAALAEREACAGIVDRVLRDVLGDQSTVYSLVVEASIRARTTPATLSTDTLAAIAEARGLCVVEPEHLAELEAAANASGGKDGAK